MGVHQACSDRANSDQAPDVEKAVAPGMVAPFPAAFRRPSVVERFFA